jgi:hypothetical protein
MCIENEVKYDNQTQAPKESGCTYTTNHTDIACNWSGRGEPGSLVTARLGTPSHPITPLAVTTGQLPPATRTGWRIGRPRLEPGPFRPAVLSRLSAPAKSPERRALGSCGRRLLTRGHARAAHARRRLARPGEIKPGRTSPGARPAPALLGTQVEKNPIMSPSSAARKILREKMPRG